MRIVITAPAETDLEAVFDYIALDSARHARTYLAGLRAKIKSIGRSPRIYPERAGLPNGIRTAAHGSHVILFRIAGNVVEIIGVIHGARDLKRLFEG